MAKVSDKIVAIVRPLAQKCMRRGSAQELSSGLDAELVKIGKLIDEGRMTPSEALKRIDDECKGFDSYLDSSSSHKIVEGIEKVLR